VPNVVTANRLTDGIVVYLTPEGGWVEDITRAARAETEEETQALEEKGKQDEKARIVVAVYAMPIKVVDGEVDPISVREKIRASHRTTLTKDWYDVPL
jgi:acetyl-CoA carboxylase carboxyltransferase component